MARFADAARHHDRARGRPRLGMPAADPVIADDD
jgi:hypothetical protein